ncbi:MAG: type II toxin-antitoxin system Phd/YefM family antitoxin [Rickettsiales bacterium]|nr:MAG: type II toxin-antitoxin system Phd/YefM family antitoxin [Rickettsiales bacterium]
MQIYTVSETRKNLFKLIDHINESHEHIIVTSKRKNAVLVSEEDWQSIQETLYLMSNKDLWQSIVDGTKEPIENCVNIKDFKW